MHYGDYKNPLRFSRIEYSIRKTPNQCPPYLSFENRPGFGLRGYPVDRIMHFNGKVSPEPFFLLLVVPDCFVKFFLSLRMKPDCAH